MYIPFCHTVVIGCDCVLLEGAGGALVTAGHGVGGLAAGGGDARPPLSLSEPTRAGAGAGARAGEPWGPPCAAGSQEAVKDGCGV